MSENVLNKILDGKIIAIVRGIPSEDVVSLAEALVAGGINCIEVTFDQTSEEKAQDTLQAISNIRKALGDRVCVGAGTVMTEKQARLAVGAGAKYLISPNVSKIVIATAVELGAVSMPGAMTPTEIVTAHGCGADFVKVFPTSSLGAGYIKAVCAPLNHIRMLAVGGVNENNIGEFLAAGAVGAGIGGNLVNKKWIAAGEFDKITELAKQYVANSR